MKLFLLITLAVSSIGFADEPFKTYRCISDVEEKTVVADGHSIVLIEGKENTKIQCGKVMQQFWFSCTINKKTGEQWWDLQNLGVASIYKHDTMLDFRGQFCGEGKMCGVICVRTDAKPIE